MIAWPILVMTASSDASCCSTTAVSSVAGPAGCRRSDANAGLPRNRSDTGIEARPSGPSAGTQPSSGIRQSIGWCPWAATASLICVKGREPKNFFAESGEGCAPFTTTWRSSSIRGSFFCA
ncbi:hypothetical protein SGRI78S_03161 [Streptomyces griseus subsp. griseus]